MSDFNLNISFPISIPVKPNFMNLTGQRFGRWVVIAYAGRTAKNVTLWLCLCDCRQVKVVRAGKLQDGRSASCGCYKSEVWGKQPRTTHGMSKTAEYQAYRNAKERCNHPTHQSYHNYGGRGIEFRFTSFEEFIADIGRKPSPGLSLDRIDNSGHYEVGNVRWATQMQQAHNKRKAVWL